MESDLQLLQLLKSAASCADKELAEAIHELSVSLCQASLLVQVDQQHLSMSALSRLLCCHKSNVTQIVDALENGGLVERKLSASDRRIAKLMLTTKGRSIADKARTLMEKRAHAMLSHLSAEEKKVSCDLLKRFLEKHYH